MTVLAFGQASLVVFHAQQLPRFGLLPRHFRQVVLWLQTSGPPRSA